LDIKIISTTDGLNFVKVMILMKAHMSIVNLLTELKNKRIIVIDACCIDTESSCGYPYENQNV
jgi:hypothetical protein